MPASQKVEYTRYGYLDVSAKPVEEPDSVYFTDQSPKFEILIENKTDRRVETTEGRDLMDWGLAVGPSTEQFISGGSIDASLEPGGTHREIIEPGLLAYEENAVLGISGVSIYGNHKEEDDGPIKFGSNGKSSIKKVLYSFAIWDRSHYNSIHEQPKKLQKWVLRFGGLTALLASIQLALIVARST